jgi:putative transposase
MWTQAERNRLAEIEKTRRYPTNLIDEEWSRIEALLAAACQERSKARVDLREVLSAIRHLACTGCAWRMLPNDFPPWQTVYWWFRRFCRRPLFRTIHDVALMRDREQFERAASPSAGIVDSQSVKAPAADQRGYDAAKKIVGRKRHVALDTDPTYTPGQLL